MGRVSQKVDEEVYAEVERLSGEYGYAAGTMLDILLAWTAADMARVDAAVDLRRVQGTERARKRRSSVPPGSLRATPSNEAEKAPKL